MKCVFNDLRGDAPQESLFPESNDDMERGPSCFTIFYPMSINCLLQKTPRIDAGMYGLLAVCQIFIYVPA